MILNNCFMQVILTEEKPIFFKQKCHLFNETEPI